MPKIDILAHQPPPTAFAESFGCFARNSGGQADRADFRGGGINLHLWP